jgi:hypothetical protein
MLSQIVIETQAHGDSETMLRLSIDSHHQLPALATSSCGSSRSSRRAVSASSRAAEHSAPDRWALLRLLGMTTGRIGSG